MPPPAACRSVTAGNRSGTLTTGSVTAVPGYRLGCIVGRVDNRVSAAAVRPEAPTRRRRPLEPGGVAQGRPVEPGIGGEGRPVEPGMANEVRLVEHGGATEGRPAEVGASHHGVFKVEVDEDGAVKIEVDAGPKAFARRIGGPRIFGAAVT